MMEMDLEDYIEEVKFQMVDAYDDVLDKETILAWEEGVRKWVEKAAENAPAFSGKGMKNTSYKNNNKSIARKGAKGTAGKSARDVSGASTALRFRGEDEVYVRVKNEEVCESAAKKYYQAVTGNALESYWRDFHII